MDTTIATAALSGFIGALAGGGISLVSQILARKWQQEDSSSQAKKELYSRISSIGANYLGDEIFDEINRDSAAALLICSKKTRLKLIKYMASIELTNNSISDKTGDERQKIVDSFSHENTSLHQDLIDAMRQELKVRD